MSEETTEVHKCQEVSKTHGGHRSLVTSSVPKCLILVLRALDSITDNCKVNNNITENVPYLNAGFQPLLHPKKGKLNFISIYYFTRSESNG